MCAASLFRLQIQGVIIALYFSCLAAQRNLKGVRLYKPSKLNEKTSLVNKTEKIPISNFV